MYWAVENTKDLIHSLSKLSISLEVKMRVICLYANMDDSTNMFYKAIKLNKKFF